MEYFVFCNYSIHFNSKMVFVPISNLKLDIPRMFNDFNEQDLESCTNTDKTPHLNKIINDFPKIIKQSIEIGPILESVYDKNYDENNKCISKSTIGYQSSNKFIQSKDISQLINTIDNLIEGFIVFHDEIYYEVNNEDRLLSANELYLKIISLKIFNDTPVKISNCLIISEVSKDYKNPICVRFFVESIKIHISKLKDLLMKQKLFSNVVIADSIVKGTNKETTYGFMYLTEIENLHKFKSLKFEDYDFIFD